MVKASYQWNGRAFRSLALIPNIGILSPRQLNNHMIASSPPSYDPHSCRVQELNNSLASAAYGFSSAIKHGT